MPPFSSSKDNCSEASFSIVPDLVKLELETRRLKGKYLFFYKIVKDSKILLFDYKYTCLQNLKKCITLKEKYIADIYSKATVRVNTVSNVLLFFP